MDLNKFDFPDAKEWLPSFSNIVGSLSTKTKAGLAAVALVATGALAVVVNNNPEISARLQPLKNKAIELKAKAQKALKDAVAFAKANPEKTVAAIVAAVASLIAAKFMLRSKDKETLLNSFDTPASGWSDADESPVGELPQGVIPAPGSDKKLPEGVLPEALLIATTKAGDLEDFGKSAEPYGFEASPSAKGQTFEEWLKLKD